MWSLIRPDGPPGESTLVVDDRVTGATADVLDAGVSLGMPRREAEALAPFARVINRDVGEETRLFEPVVAMVEDLVPRVEVVAPGLLFVPVGGAVRFYGGEEALAQAVTTRLGEYFGQTVTTPTHLSEAAPERTVPLYSTSIADGPFAARWAAASATPGECNIVTDTIGFLSGLDLGTLRESMGGEEMIDTFRWLGIVTLGDIVRLPRETLASRFGNPGLLAHRLASGEDRMVTLETSPPNLVWR